MKNLNQDGRSMVEMLGVLAIIGVLSVGGIAGYSKAMSKYKINKTTDQVSMLVANLRTLFSNQGNYAELNNKNAKGFGVVPNDMYSSDSDANITNAFAGNVTILAAKARQVGDTSANEAFIIEYAGLTSEACVTIATGDWGSGQASGLIGVAAGVGSIQTAGTLGSIGAKVNEVLVDNYGSKEDSVNIGVVAKKDLVVAAPGASVPTPITVADAVNACTDKGNGNSVAWKYY